MDAKHWSGDDDRDSLAPDYDRDTCQDCGAAADQPCVPECPCAYCVDRRAREAAYLAARKVGA